MLESLAGRLAGCGAAPPLRNGGRGPCYRAPVSASTGTRPLRVCLDARLRGSGAGGVEQVVIGLASGLSALAEDGEDEFLFLVHGDGHTWLAPYLSGRCGVLVGPPRPAEVAWKRLVRERLTPLHRLYHQVSPWLRRQMIQVPRSSGLIEAAGVDVMHFTTQAGFQTPVPTIYQPHDLQHLHLPEYFTPRERRTRDLLYGGLCAQAAMVAVTASWGRQDLIDQLGLAPDKVRVVEWAPVLTAYPNPTDADLALARREHHLPDAFVLYPARMWPHKNHLRLLEALALARDRQGVGMHLVCTGSRTEHSAAVDRRAQALGLGGQVHQLGFVSPLTLQCLYRLCRAVAIPTRFEAASFPLWEAFLAGAPAACSSVTSLPAQAGDSALVFDEQRPEAIADALLRLWRDPELRATLVERARANVARFTWERTARVFRAHYRRLAGRALSDEDRALVEAPPLL